MSEVVNPIKIELSYDGWCIFVGNKLYSWDHNDEDLGTVAIATLLKDLGHTVEVVDV